MKSYEMMMNPAFIKMKDQRQFISPQIDAWKDICHQMNDQLGKPISHFKLKCWDCMNHSEIITYLGGDFDQDDETWKLNPNADEPWMNFLEDYEKEPKDMMEYCIAYSDIYSMTWIFKYDIPEYIIQRFFTKNAI